MTTMSNETKTAFSKAAAELMGALETRTRDDGKTFVTLTDAARDSWMKEAVYEAHGDRLPDDWIYAQCKDAAEEIANHEEADEAQEAAHEWADSTVDVHNTNLTAWLALHVGNIAICDEAVEELGAGSAGGLVGIMQAGQFKALSDIYGALLSAVEKRAREIEQEGGK